MEQAQKRYIVGFSLTMKVGQVILSPVHSCDDEETAKRLGNELLGSVRAMPKEYIQFLNLLGIDSIGVSAIGIPSPTTSAIVAPPSGLILPR